MNFNFLLGFTIPAGILSFFNWGVTPEVKPHQSFVINKSGTVIDCRGGTFNSGKVTEMIVVSGPINQLKNVVIRNCKLNGSIRVFGMGRNGEAPVVKASSIKPGHTQRAQAAAPTNVLISNMQIQAAGRTPVYIAPGVTNTTLQNSRLTGYSTSVALYLDAESARNVIRNNTFLVTPVAPYREVLAVDGSAENLIINNRFPDVRYGGIYLYRNCGEGGVIRHQSPIKNTIEKNSFGLKRLAWGSYGIWLGSRDGNRSYCSDDKGYPFGSSDNDGDDANQNVLTGNTFDGSARTIRNDGRNNIIRK
jgi:hypothetical protein